MVCSAGTFAIYDIANLVFAGEPTCNFLNVCGLATATGVPPYQCAGGDTPVLPFSEAETESASIEDDRVIPFRPIGPESRRALHSANVRLSSDAVRFVERARGRRLRFEEDPELQSE